MSAFGMGSTYTPYAQQNQQAMAIAQSVPGYQNPSGLLAASPINWNPAATDPWKTEQYVSGYEYETDYNPFRPLVGQNANKYSGNAVYSQVPWQNPIANLFGSNTDNLGGVGLGKQVGFSSFAQPDQSKSFFQPTGDVTNDARAMADGQVGHATNYSDPFNVKGGVMDPKGGKAPDPQVLSPNSVQDLYSQVGQLDGRQLAQLSGQWAGVNARFQGAANIYANAYANEDYAKQAGMSQQDTSNWLQAAYNRLSSGMSANGFL